MLKMFTSMSVVAVAGTAIAQSLAGEVSIDGSSTVYPITAAVAEAFADEEGDVDVTVGVSGTGGGFRRFIAGETDISDASRPIKAKELEAATEAGISFIEVPVAYDGLTIVVNRAENDFVDQLTVEQLTAIFSDGSEYDTWDDVNSDWPETAIDIYAPGTNSGTFDYFREVVLGGEGSMRSDVNTSEDDNVLVQGVAGSAGGIGFFGCAYYFENDDTLRAISIVNSEGEAIEPTVESIEDGSYEPFSRPLFIYVNAEALDRPEVSAFVEFYMDECADIAEEVGYVRLPDEIYDAAIANILSRSTGTQFLTEDGEKVEGPVTEVYGEL